MKLIPRLQEILQEIIDTDLLDDRREYSINDLKDAYDLSVTDAYRLAHAILNVLEINATEPYVYEICRCGRAQYHYSKEQLEDVVWASTLQEYEVVIHTFQSAYSNLSPHDKRIPYELPVWEFVRPCATAINGDT